MTSVFTFTFNGDIYESALAGTTLTRVSRYFDGSGRREDVEDFDALPAEVKDLILEKAIKVIRMNQ